MTRQTCRSAALHCRQAVVPKPNWSPARCADKGGASARLCCSHELDEALQRLGQDNTECLQKAVPCAIVAGIAPGPLDGQTDGRHRCGGGTLGVMRTDVMSDHLRMFCLLYVISDSDNGKSPARREATVVSTEPFTWAWTACVGKMRIQNGPCGAAYLSDEWRASAHPSWREERFMHLLRHTH